MSLIFGKYFQLTIDAALRFLQKLQDGRIVVTSQDLPTFLYENSKYDPIEMDSGLCRSGILVRVRISL